ncbi:hypothetical protein KC19_1G164900 [Ceratodon purpureus]|uniref:Uncharacterized protein n=1 Tax=Ceratodon purpureus TaxID=3225 RepID=A0A8T0J8U3_CERPU|nr:hypothetical protein KC19_1G164900 [Ceratodon purpureus]
MLAMWVCLNRVHSRVKCFDRFSRATIIHDSSCTCLRSSDHNPQMLSRPAPNFLPLKRYIRVQIREEDELPFHNDNDVQIAVKQEYEATYHNTIQHRRI